MSSTDPVSTSGSAKSGAFPATRWTVVLGAGDRDAERARGAIGELCAIYHGSIRSWLERDARNSDAAEDLAQGFMHYLLSKNRFESFQRRNTKFRSFLLECLKRYLRDEWKRDTAQKRGSGAVPVDINEFDPGVRSDIDVALDTEFALIVHGRVISQLAAAKYAGEAKRRRLEELRRFILGAASEGSYVDVASRLGITVGAVKKAVFDLRDAYVEIFRSEVLETVAFEVLNEEMRYLLSLLARTEAVDS